MPRKKLSTLVHAYNRNAGEADRWISETSWTDSWPSWCTQTSENPCLKESYMDGLLLRNVTQGCPLASTCTKFAHAHTYTSDMLYTAANNCQAKSIQVVQGRSHVNDSFEL